MDGGHGGGHGMGMGMGMHASGQYACAWEWGATWLHGLMGLGGPDVN